MSGTQRSRFHSLDVVAVAPPLPAMVEQHELRDVGQRRERVRQARVVEARAAVQKQQRRPLAHRRPVRDELGADHLEEDPRAVAQGDPHPSATSFSFSRLERTSRRAAVFANRPAKRAAPCSWTSIVKATRVPSPCGSRSNVARALTGPPSVAIANLRGGSSSTTKNFASCRIPGDAPHFRAGVHVDRLERRLPLRRTLEVAHERVDELLRLRDLDDVLDRHRSTSTPAPRSAAARRTSAAAAASITATPTDL